MTFRVDKRDGKEDYCHWYLSGEITKDDAKLVEQLLQKNFKKCKQNDPASLELWVHLNSNGGDIEAAMSIGRLLRKHGVQTAVGEHSKCLSSCIFLLVSGLDRWGYSDDIGVHRPYFADLKSQTDINEIRNMRFKRTESIKTYLTEMDIPISLLDLMMAVPPDKIRYLTYEEIKYFGLVGKDPSWEEKQNALFASRHGLTSSEYREIEATTKNTCINAGNRLSFSNDQYYWECSRAILYGVSIETYRKKSKLFPDKCGELEDDKQISRCFRSVLQAP